MFAALKAKLEAIWHKIDGEAGAEIRQALTDVETELAKVRPLLTAFETDLKTAVASAEPQIKADVEALLQKLLADAGGLLGGESSGM